MDRRHRGFRRGGERRALGRSRGRCEKEGGTGHVRLAGRNMAAGFADAAMVACAASMYFLVRYVLVVKWPDRFVDTTEG